MKWVLIILGGLAVLLILLVIVGMLLPRDHQATSEIVLSDPPERIWPVIRDPGAMLGSWSELESARQVEDPEGREVWEQKVGGFSMRLVVSRDDAPTDLVTTIDSPPGAAFGGRWIYRIEATGDGGSRVRITEDGWIRNPLYRVMAQVGGLHRSLDGYLRALGRRFGQELRPVHLP